MPEGVDGPYGIVRAVGHITRGARRFGIKSKASTAILCLLRQHEAQAGEGHRGIKMSDSQRVLAGIPVTQAIHAGVVGGNDPAILQGDNGIAGVPDINESVERGDAGLHLQRAETGVPVRADFGKTGMDRLDAGVFFKQRVGKGPGIGNRKAIAELTRLAGSQIQIDPQRRAGMPAARDFRVREIVSRRKRIRPLERTGAADKGIPGALEA